MLKLCGFHLSNYHNKVRLALLEKGVPFTEDSGVHPSQKDEYLALSPMGKVPYAEVDGARRLYGGLFFGGTLSEATRQSVEKDLAKGIRAFKALAKFDPFVAGRELTLADCAAAAHLPLVTLATKMAYGRDFLEDVPQVKPYLKMLGERPAFARVNADRKAAQEAMRAQAKK